MIMKSPMLQVGLFFNVLILDLAAASPQFNAEKFCTLHEAMCNPDAREFEYPIDFRLVPAVCKTVFASLPRASQTCLTDNLDTAVALQDSVYCATPQTSAPSLPPSEAPPSGTPTTLPTRSTVLPFVYCSSSQVTSMLMSNCVVNLPRLNTFLRDQGNANQLYCFNTAHLTSSTKQPASLCSSIDATISSHFSIPTSSLSCYTAYPPYKYLHFSNYQACEDSVLKINEYFNSYSTVSPTSMPTSSSPTLSPSLSPTITPTVLYKQCDIPFANLFCASFATRCNTSLHTSQWTNQSSCQDFVNTLPRGDTDDAHAGASQACLDYHLSRVPEVSDPTSQCEAAGGGGVCAIPASTVFCGNFANHSVCNSSPGTSLWNKASFDSCERFVNNLPFGTEGATQGASQSCLIHHLELASLSGSKGFCPGAKGNAPCIGVPPTMPPTISPTAFPTPSESPSASTPTTSPILTPTSFPTVSIPTSAPTLTPTSSSPTASPTMVPTSSTPTLSPSWTPSSSSPTMSPTTTPTMGVTMSPTGSPSSSSSGTGAQSGSNAAVVVGVVVPFVFVIIVVIIAGLVILRRRSLNRDNNNNNTTTDTKASQATKHASTVQNLTFAEYAEYGDPAKVFGVEQNPYDGAYELPSNGLYEDVNTVKGGAPNDEYLKPTPVQNAYLMPSPVLHKIPTPPNNQSSAPMFYDNMEHMAGANALAENTTDHVYDAYEHPNSAQHNDGSQDDYIGDYDLPVISTNSGTVNIDSYSTLSSNHATYGKKSKSSNESDTQA